MKLFDSHCHFETTDASVIRAQLVRAREAGVAHILAVGGSDALNAAAVAAAKTAAEDPSLPTVALALGYDRDQTVGLADDVTLPDFAAMAGQDGFSALGEIGLDYHYSPETRAAQLRLFSAQLEEARKRDLPVVIHTREADDDTIALLREIPSRGVIHCYTGTPEYARRFLELGFYISISGIVTFRAADNVRESALVVPDDRLLIETDSPYLAPVPMRGSANEPAYVRHTCEFLAALRGVSAEDLARITCENAERLFKGFFD